VGGGDVIRDAKEFRREAEVRVGRGSSAKDKYITRKKGDRRKEKLEKKCGSRRSGVALGPPWGAEGRRSCRSRVFGERRTWELFSPFF